MALALPAQHGFADPGHGLLRRLASFVAASVQDFQNTFWILLVFEAAAADWLDPFDQVVGHGGFALDAADAGGRQPVRTHSRRPGSRSGVENSLCQSKTGQTSGLPGSVRRLRAGSVTITLVLARMSASDSESVMALPYDLDILRPSRPGMRGVGVRRAAGSSRTLSNEKKGFRSGRELREEIRESHFEDALTDEARGDGDLFGIEFHVGRNDGISGGYIEEFEKNVSAEFAILGAKEFATSPKP